MVIYEILDKYFEYTNKQRKILEDEYDSQFQDYRDIIQEERTKYINHELSKLSIHEKLGDLNLDIVLIYFDATSLYPSAMYDEKSVNPKTEIGFVFISHMNKTYVDAFKNQPINQDGNESAISKL